MKTETKMNPPNITPGEWRPTCPPSSLLNASRLVQAENGHTVAEVLTLPGEIRTQEAVANARAIAALPQCLRSLLGAYKALRTALPHVDPDSGDYSYVGEWLDEVKETLLAAGYTE